MSYSPDLRGGNDYVLEFLFDLIFSELQLYVSQVYISELWLFNLQLRVCITQFWEIKKSELWDKTSQ